MEQAVAVILLGGKAARFKKEKALQSVGGVPMFIAASRPFEESGVVDRIVYVVRKDLVDEVNRLLKEHPIGIPYDVVLGGATREESAEKGLEMVWKDIPALVHDACRPYLSPALVRRVYVSVEEGAVVVPGLPPRDAVYEPSSDSYVNRDDYVLVETPQGMLPKDFLEAAKKVPDYKSYVDEGSIFLKAGMKVIHVPGEPGNLKVTYPGDVK